MAEAVVVVVVEMPIGQNADSRNPDRSKSGIGRKCTVKYGLVAVLHWHLLDRESVVSCGNATQGQETSMATATRLPLALTTNNTENLISGGLRWKNGGGVERRRMTVGCVCLVRSGK
ncbi:hypothetical protein M514_05152 [Trichuris suis]|uniref:Uncharacterized protein n=1 Tax=Trichuris suis TaxID=68888 RepID=A0A085MZV4_9BILA|nr:hypothetical protein M513_05152 [Trichuris suis]KFD62750.1 hypothetical protein M514_05152 [Trichuris suis]